MAAVALVNGLVWMLLVPPFQIPDEDQHVAYAQYVAETGKLPVDRPGRSFSPELDATLGAVRVYHLIGRPYEPALWSASQSAELKAVEAQHLSRVGQGDAEAATNNPPLYYLAEAIPYRVGTGGTLLDRLYLMRLESVLLGVATVLFCFLFLRELLPARPWAWTVGSLAVALQPLFDFISAGVNNDNLLWTCAAAVFYLLARAFRRGLTLGTGVALGAASAAGVLTKASMLGFAPAILLALVVLGWRQRREPRTGRALLATCAAAVGPVLVYFLLTATVWTRQLYPGRDVVTAPGVTGQFHVREYLSFTWQLIFPRPPWLNDLIPGLPIRDTFLHGFIGRFGWVDYGFSPSHQRLASWILVAVGILALVGLITRWRAVRVRWAELATYAVAAAGLVAVIGAAAYRARLSGGTGFEQARYLLPLLPLYGAVVATAAGAARRFAPVLGAALVLLALAHDVFAQLLTVARYYS